MTERLRTIGFLSGLFLAVLFSSASYAERTDAEKMNAEQSAKFLDLLKERGFALKILDDKTTVDLKEWPKDSATGATVRRLSGVKAGLAPSSLPGVKFISSEEAKSFNAAEQKTGLFLVGIDFVPRELSAALKAFRYTLHRDGTLLDANGEPILAMVTSEVYLVEKKRMGSLSSFFISEANAANPFPWRCYSFTPWAVYHGGFHRWYDARTWADTYGADSSGGCSSGSPHTRVDYIYTRAAVGGWGDSDHCFNCESEYSRDTWDVGYWWPAHGIPVTTHHAVYADGNFSFSRTSHLTW